MNHKQITATFRNAIKAAGIAAKVRMYKSAQFNSVEVYTATYGQVFTAEEQAQVLTLAAGMGFRGIVGKPLDLSDRTYFTMFAFTV